MMIKDTDQQAARSFALSSPKTIGLTLALALFGAPALYAQDTAQAPGPAAFDALDANGDGNISFDEFSSREASMIDRLDSDANGVLTLDEFLNARPPRPQDRGPRHSAEKREERSENRPQPSAEQQTTREDRRAARNEKMAERHAMMQEMLEARFVTADANGDQVVTADELLEASFLELDADNNGALTKEELAKRGGPRGNVHMPR
ncbi:EF-hand domain-containing protein [Gammaproteobacteria bacterium]|nr:EF-hand domain-containing protein [Gammaproteobacteria bacterium]